MSSIEAKIKRKIESVGKPLKDWDIRINYGIKTGCNEAFIVDSAARTKILDRCSDEAERNRTAEIIRPILRGRDIKKYGYDFADNFLVAFFPSRKYDIDDFPSLKQYLLHFSEQELRENGFNWIADNPETLMSYSKQKLEQSGEPIMIDGHTISFGETQQKSRKLTSNKWFETQDSISYWDDFNKPKIIYPNMTKYLPFVYDDKGYYTNQKCFILTGKHVAYLTALFNSSLFKYCFRDAFPELLGGTRELSKIFFDKIPILEVTDKVDNEFRVLLDDIQGEYTIEKHIAIDKKIFSLYQLSEDEMNTIGFIEIR